MNSCGSDETLIVPQNRRTGELDPIGRVAQTITPPSKAYA